MTAFAEALGVLFSDPNLSTRRFTSRPALGRK